MRKMLRATLLIILLSTSGYSSEPLLFSSAGSVSEKSFTTYDIFQHMEKILLDDDQRIAIFKQAEKDYFKYQELMRGHLKDYFKSSLKLVMYNRVLQAHATKSKNVKSWKAFRVKPRMLEVRVKDAESKVLKPLLERQVTLKDARVQFGEFLKKSGYPHQKESSAQDVYQDWLDTQEYRIKFQFQSQEAQRYELIMAMGPRKELYTVSSQQSQFYNKNVALIEDNLSNKELNPEEVRKFVSIHPELKIFIKNIQYLGIKNSSMAKIYQNNSEDFQNAKKYIIEKMTPNLNDQKIEKILSYENMATKIASEHKDISKLKSQEKRSMEIFIATGSYKELMKSRLYSLAAAQVDFNPDRKKTRENIKLSLGKTFAEVKKDLKSDHFYLNDKTDKLLFEDFISRMIKLRLEKNLQSEYKEYLQKVLELAAWTIKFDAKKIAVKAPQKVLISVKPYNSYETQKAIDSYLKTKELEALILRFRQEKLRPDMEWLIKIRPDAQEQLTDTDAFNWIFE